MAVINKMNDREKKNFYQSCLDDTLLQACRPSTSKGETIIRIIPEVAADGSIRPMVNASTRLGIDFTNFHIETVTIGVGKEARFSGISRSSNRVNEDAFSMAFPGLFIRLRSKQKKKEIPDHLKDLVDDVLGGGMKAALRSSPEMALVQAVVFKLNDKVLEKPAPRQCVFLTTTAAETISEVLTHAHEEGVDVFAPKTGHLIKLVPVKQRGSNIMLYEAELGERAPLSEDACRKLWVPWEDRVDEDGVVAKKGALRLHTFEEHMELAVRCFGNELVQLAFPDEHARLFGEAEQPRTVKKGSPKNPGADIDLGVGELEDSAPAEDRTEAVVELQIETELPTTPPDDGGDEDDAGTTPSKSAAKKSSPEGSATVLDPADADANAAFYESLLEDM